MKIITKSWKGRDSKYYNPRMGFGICRLLDELKRAGRFIPTTDLLKLYSITNDLNLGEFTDSLVNSLHEELVTFYNRVSESRLLKLKAILMDSVESGILVDGRVVYRLKLLRELPPGTQEARDVASAILMQTSTVPHVADKYGQPNAEVLGSTFIDELVNISMPTDLLIAMVKICMLPPEWRGLSRLPNDTVLENSPHEYVQQNLIPRFAEKSYDTPTPGVSRACSTDPFTLLLTTKSTMGIDYGKPRGHRDLYYRILCDIYSEKK